MTQPVRPDPTPDIPDGPPQGPVAADLDARVAIVGGGLAGLSLAIALAQAGVATLCIDRDAPALQLDVAFDGRTTALALASCRLLQRLGVWPLLAEHAGAIFDIRVADQNSPLHLHYDHRDVGAEPFGHVIDNPVLRQALHRRARDLPTLTHLAPAQVVGIERGPACALLSLADGRRVRTELVVGADGRDSFCRRQAGIGVTGWRYRQSAITCNIAHERPHHGIALEHFLPSGPFAVLPLPGERASIVWSLDETRLGLYRDLPDEAFARELEQRAGPWLGRITPITRRWCWPLGVMHAERYIDRRLALIGEAAHIMHPIAGQGLNMGLRDVAALADVIVDAHRLGLDVGAPDGLERYQRWRRFDNLSLVAVTDGLTRLFSNDLPPLRAARRLGLAAVDHLPPLKRLFMRHAMGVLGDLPRLMAEPARH